MNMSSVFIARPVTTTLLMLGLLVFGTLSAWLRAPGFMQGGFASHDVGGILYNAMVIEHGFSQ